MKYTCRCRYLQCRYSKLVSEDQFHSSTWTLSSQQKCFQAHLRKICKRDCTLYIFLDFVRRCIASVMLRALHCPEGNERVANRRGITFRPPTIEAFSAYIDPKNLHHTHSSLFALFPRTLSPVGYSFTVTSPQNGIDTLATV